jgi:hypothetical protein
MPIHDWNRVNARTYHSFHNSWITHLEETMNAGLLPEGYFARSENHAGRRVTDLHLPPERDPEADGPKATLPGMMAASEKPPRVSRKLVASPYTRATQRSLAIRHTSDGRIVALLEITSPVNKNRPASVSEFVAKAYSALENGCHLLVVDLLLPGAHDPLGMHAAIWERYAVKPYDLPAPESLSLASYVALDFPVAYVEHVALGGQVPDMPMFLDTENYINVPLAATYEAAYGGISPYWRRVVEGRLPEAGA